MLTKECEKKKRNPKALTPYMARVEFLACKDEIMKLLEGGNPISEIFRILSASGKIKMSYRSLLHHVNKIKAKDKGEKKEEKQKETTEKTDNQIAQKSDIKQEPVPFGKRDPKQPYNKNI